MTKWEYRVTKVVAGGAIGRKLDGRSFSEMLNEQGEEGWELVTAFDTVLSTGESHDIVSVFKRLKPKQAQS